MPRTKPRQALRKLRQLKHRLAARAKLRKVRKQGK
jgi:hypothetical protein